MESHTIRSLQERVALNQDEAAFRKLFHYFYNNLLSFATNLLRSEVAAEEVVSDVMLKIWQMRESLLKVDDLRVYLFRAVKNRVINYSARIRRNQLLENGTDEIITADPELNPEDRLQKSELQQHLAMAVRALPPRCATVYYLVKEEGLTYKEVAGIMEISENTVDRQLNNALHKLIKAMKDYLEDEAPKKQFKPAVRIKQQERRLKLTA